MFCSATSPPARSITRPASWCWTPWTTSTASSGTTTAVITHNAGIAAMADRVVRLRSGRIVEIHRNATRAAPSDLEW